MLYLVHVLSSRIEIQTIFIMMTTWCYHTYIKYIMGVYRVIGWEEQGDIAVIMLFLSTCTFKTIKGSTFKSSCQNLSFPTDEF